MSSARELAREASRQLKRDKGGGTRNQLKEHMIAKFVGSTIHKEKPTDMDFADWIRDGTILMDMMTTLAFNSVEADPFGTAGENPDQTRIRNLIDSMIAYGVDRKNIFTVPDLYESRNIPKVVKCLEDIETLAKEEEHVNFASMNPMKFHS